MQESDLYKAKYIHIYVGRQYLTTVENRLDCRGNSSGKSLIWHGK